MNEAAREERMQAGNFDWNATLPDGKTLHVVVTHKLSQRTWERDATEESWPEVRLALLADIEKDLSTPFDVVPMK